ncbi:hypothetical protein GpartN1_g2042.t1 [Galdieria partita]|uniref:F-box domain-containing protein n=1 Tax=Galdieria partita TaxID=83374 RepID=A0A9C7PTM8_9RHOD|nr:hypothetical protein GpartN1_g2042.t1 [Galdieria partita]
MRWCKDDPSSWPLVQPQEDDYDTFYPSLLSLPLDTLLRICSYLPGYELAKLQIAVSSKAFVQATSDAHLWRTAFYRDFGRKVPPEIYIHQGNIDWKYAYATRFVKNRTNQKVLRENFIREGNIWRFPRTLEERQRLASKSEIPL